MKTRIKQWLRSLIGWEEITQYDSRLEAITSHLAEVEEQLKRLEDKMPRRRDHAYASLAITDFETVQAMFLNDPKNFERPKEMN